MTCHGPEGRERRACSAAGRPERPHGDCTHHAGFVINGLTGEITVDGTK